MGMYLSTTMSIGAREFTRICEEQEITPPIVNEDEYCSTVTEELYKEYKERAFVIISKINLFLSINRSDIDFLFAWRVIDNARIEWLIANDHEIEEPWSDLLFT